MSTWGVRELQVAEFPPLLAEIPQPPKTLFAVGNLPPPELTLLAVVGSRKYTTYGKQAIEHLISGLRGYPVGIVSGLAIGMDTLAHEAALKNDLYTLSVPGSGLHESVIYPATNRRLASRILEAGGGLLSELAPTAKAAKWTFPARNRIMAGICRATLLIEAGEKSGTLITARMTADYNRELLVVPGSIFSATSVGTNQFLKLGATPVTNSEDILMALQIEPHQDEATPRLGVAPLSPETELILSVLHEPLDRDSIIRAMSISTSAANMFLMQAELEGHIVAEGGIYTAITRLEDASPLSLFDRNSKN